MSSSRHHKCRSLYKTPSAKLQAPSDSATVNRNRPSPTQPSSIFPTSQAPLFSHPRSPKLQLKNLIPRAQNPTPRTRPTLRHLGARARAEDIDAIGTETRNTLGAGIAFVEGVDASALGAVDLHGLLVGEGGTDVGVGEAGGGHVEVVARVGGLERFDGREGLRVGFLGRRWR